MIRKISAHYIYPVSSPPLKNGIVVIDKSGVIVDVIDTNGSLQEAEKLEFFNGVITPGFVNAHAHIELSHLRNKIPRNSGITEFIRHIQLVRNNGNITKAISQAEIEMINNGIVAVGDIVNTELTFEIKKRQKLLYHSFVEIFATNPEKAGYAWEKGISLYSKLKDQNLQGSVAPHAPYSISSELWNKLCNNHQNTGSFWSIHNQESQDENLLYLNKTGKFPVLLQKFSPSFNSWHPPAKTSIQAMFDFVSVPDKLLLVHNTFTSLADLEVLLPIKQKIFLVLCPRSNLYIENTLPNAMLFDTEGFTIAVGTDSLASNSSLSIVEELKTLHEKFSFSFDKLILWATLNGAKALGFENGIGTIEIGKKPGLNLITDFNFGTMNLTKKSKVKVLA